MASVATEPPAVSAGAPRESLTQGLTGARFYLILCAVALAIGAVSLAVPSTPSYDPWSWLIWGREIVHLNLQTTGGPTWKPLPIIFITVFSLFGKAAPDLWLIVARAGGFMAAVMVFKLAATLARLLVDGPPPRDGASALERFSAHAPSLLGGAVAAVTLVFTVGFISDNALGYSEGLMTALVLIAVERHLDGKPRQAFAIGLGAALDRPEVWIFWGPYGLWLFWRDPGARKLVLALFALIPILWFAPEYWGSGHFFRGVNRAQHPRSNSAAFAKCPFCAELVKHAWSTVLLRVKLAAALGAGVAGWLLWRLHGARGKWRLTSSREHALGSLMAAGLLGLGWFVLIALMTQGGFSGNDRYLILGSALVDIAGGAAFGWAALALAGKLRGMRLSAQAASLGGAGLMVLVYLIVPNWVGKNLIDIQRTHRALVYQATLTNDVSAAIDRLGGPGKVLACGSVMTEGFQVPDVAFALGAPLLHVEASPLSKSGMPAANVVFQMRATRHASLLPPLGYWPATHYKLVAQLKALKVYASCAGGATL